LSALGFPIHGDELYGGAPAERVYLHAYLYALKWDAGELEIKAKNAPLFDGLISLDFDSIL
jgi:tRNA pseudouridine32 synthase/23S rRNA pseudouridine746 synthase